MRPTRHRVSLLFVYGGFHGWVTESYSGENVGHRPGERAAVLPRATIDITEIAIRFQNEITLAATITPRPRAMRDDRRPPTLRNCTELSTAPRVSARAFPVDANLRDLARLHAGHGAILRFNQSLGYGKLSWDWETKRADAILIAANVSHVRHSDSSISSGREASRRLPI